MSRYKMRFPELVYLLSGYFHQDWLHVYDWNGAEPNFQAIVRHFKVKNPPHVTTQASQELEQFLSLPLNEEELHEALREMGSAYYAIGNGQTFRHWLEEVLAVLREPLGLAGAMRVIS